MKYVLVLAFLTSVWLMFRKSCRKCGSLNTYLLTSSRPVGIFRNSRFRFGPTYYHITESVCCSDCKHEVLLHVYMRPVYSVPSEDAASSERKVTTGDPWPKGRF